MLDRRCTILSLAVVLTVAVVCPALAQLPPEAVDLALVKVPEAIKSEDICPVTLVPSDLEGETWTHEGVSYRGHGEGVEAEFMTDPATYAGSAAKERYVQNFMLAMSSIWCPITDEVTPGGRKQVEGLGYIWESCCSFCDDEMRVENFDQALERLRQRAGESYEMNGGTYTEGASSPVEGAIKDDF